MTFDGTKEQLADRLEAEKSEVEKLGFALALLTPQSEHEINCMVYRINEWINDACEALRGVDTNQSIREAA